MNLAQTASLFRRIVSIVIVLLIAYIIVRISIPIAKGGWAAINPPKDPPTVLFGKLDPLIFVEKPVANQDIEFKLETTSGRLPTGFPNKLAVYRYKEIPVSLTAGRKAQFDAQSLGFSDDELTTDLKGEIYTWKDDLTSAKLEINTKTAELELITPIIGRESQFPIGVLNEQTATSKAKQILSSIGRRTDPQYARETEASVTFLRIQDNTIFVTEVPSDAHLAKVDFYRNVAGYPIIGPEPQTGLISVLVSASTSRIKTLEFPLINVHEWGLINDDSSTYPIISVSEAWDAVANQKLGVITNISPVETTVFGPTLTQRVDTILIDNIYLAYYDTPEQQQFIQPIYVFEGKYNVNNRPGGTITLYFPAIQGQYINAAPEEDTNPIPGI